MPRKALMAMLAELGVTEKDWRRIQKARAVVHDVNDEVASRGGVARWCVIQVTAHDKPDPVPFGPVDEF